MQVQHFYVMNEAFSNSTGSVRRHVSVLIDNVYFSIFGQGEAREVYQVNGLHRRKVTSKRRASEIIATADAAENSSK